jgi:hypothetical protein
MQLLKRQFPDISGFSDPVMVASLRCKFADKIFVQVVYNGSHHWITATNKHCPPGVVRVYDGMHLTMNTDVKQQLATMCQTTHSVLEIQSMNVARQIGSGDCGLLALAYATTLCLDLDPVNLVYCQDNLRKHFLQCVTDGRMTAFPVSSNRTVRKPVSFISKEKVHCICRQMYVRGQDMILCQLCGKWYHATCLAMTSSAFAEAAAQAKYTCVQCSDDN